MRQISAIGLIIAIFLFPSISSAQEKAYGTWRSYRAYQSADLVEKTDRLVFAVYDGSLLSYSPDDSEVRTYSLAEGLNDSDIAHIKYFANAQTLLIVYSNSNIDLFIGEHNVHNLSSIKDDLFIQNKTVNSIVEIDGLAYLCTAFGIVVVDIAKKEIKSTYRLGVDTRSVCRWNDELYAATSEGVLKASVSSNLQDKNNWTYYPIEQIPNDKEITQLIVFKEILVVRHQSRALYYHLSTGEGSWFSNGPIKQVLIIRNELVQVNEDKILFHTSFWTRKEVNRAANSIASDTWSSYWLAEGESGLTEINRDQYESDYTVKTSRIIMNSPKRNLAFQMVHTGKKLLVVGGGRTWKRSNNPGTLMVYENGKWTSFDDEAISEKTGIVCEDFISVSVDPRDPMRYFVASFGQGLYEFKDNEFVRLHNAANSTLEASQPKHPINNVLADGAIFDKNGNLYVNTSLTEKFMNVYSSDNTWSSFSYPGLSNSTMGRQIIDKNNRLWGTVYTSTEAGVFVIDTKNTPTNENDDTFYYGRQFTDQQGRAIGAKNYYCLAQDKNGTIWVGTDNGPICFSGPDKVQNGTCTRPVLEDEYGEGYYLLQGQKINHIAIDGANRKWMATDGGVFVVDQSGSETTVVNYNRNNSFILSDVINCIALNDKTGEAFIATDKGICSLMSEATEGSSDYSEARAYPNPVRPASNNHVVISGLMANSTVKITDMAGNLMTEGSSQGGQFAWNCTNSSGQIVKAGIYLVLASTEAGQEGIVTKIMVIK